jgi:hypothetical protein
MTWAVLLADLHMGASRAPAAPRPDPPCAGPLSATIRDLQGVIGKGAGNLPRRQLSGAVTVLWCNASKSFRPSKIRRSSAELGTKEKNGTEDRMK